MSDYASSAMRLTTEQARVIVGIERAGASLSLLGVLLIIVTFALFKRLRTVPNTFILFASIANIGASVASLIGMAGLGAGLETSLCKAQAFLLEMFMQSDPWWSFAMAFNVFLVFFFSANPTTFRRHLWVYCLVCFGIPMIPSIVCLELQKKDREPIYGDATLWCWIGDDWSQLRIYSYYIPIWMCIFLSFVIYVAVGYHVFHQRNQLRNISLSNPAKDVSSSEVRDSADKNLTTTASSGCYGTVTTEVQITTQITTDHSSPVSSRDVSGPCPWGDDPFPKVATSSNSPVDEELGALPVSPPAIHGAGGARAGFQGASTTISAAPPPPIPSWHLHPQHVQPPPQTPQMTTSTSPLHRPRSFLRTCRSKLRHMDPVKLAYLRTSFVFAISVLVTWTPSSINRVYGIVKPHSDNYGLNIASAAVLPLQGLWNAVIYFTTSWRLLSDEVQRMGHGWRWLRRLGAPGSGPAEDRTRTPSSSRPHHHHLHLHSHPHHHLHRLSSDDDNDDNDNDSGGMHDETLYTTNHRHLQPTTSHELELCPRRPSQFGTLRVQKGGQLDT